MLHLDLLDLSHQLPNVGAILADEEYSKVPRFNCFDLLHYRDPVFEHEFHLWDMALVQAINDNELLHVCCFTEQVKKRLDRVNVRDHLLWVVGLLLQARWQGILVMHQELS